MVGDNDKGVCLPGDRRQGRFGLGDEQNEKVVVNEWRGDC